MFCNLFSSPIPNCHAPAWPVFSLLPGFFFPPSVQKREGGAAAAAAVTQPFVVFVHIPPTCTSALQSHTLPGLRGLAKCIKKLPNSSSASSFGTPGICYFRRNSIIFERGGGGAHLIDGPSVTRIPRMAGKGKPPCATDSPAPPPPPIVYCFQRRP